MDGVNQIEPLSPAGLDDVRSQILLAEAHPLVRKGLTDLINRQSDLRVCDASHEFDSALRLTHLLQPDLVIIGTLAEAPEPLELLRRIKAIRPHQKVLLFSSREDWAFAHQVIEADAQGFLLRNEPTAILLRAIRTVLSGELFLSAQIRNRMLPCSAIAGTKTDPSRALTAREREVLRLMGQGFNSDAIAHELGISIRTVATHRTRIKTKLNFPNIAELIRRAWEAERVYAA